MGSRGSAGFVGATLRLTVVTTVMAGDATFVFLSGGCGEDVVADAEAVRVPFVVVVEDDLEAAGAGLPPKKLIMAASMKEWLRLTRPKMCFRVRPWY